MGLRSLVLLALHFWKHVLKKVTLTYRRGGSERFVANYRPDRLLPIEPQTRAALRSWQSCTACGICDAVYAKPGPSVMAIVAAGSRDFSVMPEVAADAARLDDRELLAAAGRACPMGVPIEQVVAYVAGAPERLERALANSR